MDTNNKDFQSMMSSFMQNAQKFQENLKTAYQTLAEKNKDLTVEGHAGGDLVTVKMNLKLEVVKIEGKPALFEEKPEVICELIAAATNQAISRAQEAVKKEMLAATQKMGLPTDMPMPFNPGDK